jgi:uncharacterized integral membrane protein
VAGEQYPRRPDPAPLRGGQQSRSGSNWRHWLLGIALLLLAIICLQNSQQVEINILFINTTAPLIAALVIAAALGAVVGYVAPILRRHRRSERGGDSREEA